ncbi:uncharacterized protein loc101236893 [Stylonychia lemnae]|uniref:Uncharacterized protein loc101236893 n=1 Tax=Stylonychia lemnae TaxID=5949 RepID=A0A078AHG4_STYLE|nr:uncharacterized protein loc101236893 [Stylonychia lemnae]|eukprot:CDW81286.1 uncharacterized protein loc101236893 [Stylonychia lemnae]
MEESLKCQFCSNFAINAVESNCDCALLYCERCSHLISSCMTCQKQLSMKEQAPEQQIFGFTENKLARRLINQLQTQCRVQNCGYRSTISELDKHWSRCSLREYICAYCGVGIIGKQCFKEHVVTTHEQKFLNIFDSCLKGAIIKSELENKNLIDKSLDLLQMDKNQPQEDFGFHIENHQKIQDMEDQNYQNEYGFEEEEEKIQRSDINQELRHNIKQNLGSFQLVSVEDAVNRESMELSRKNSSPRDNRWQCFKCQTINTLEHPKCTGCKGEFLKNFVQIKDEVKNFIEKIRKDQQREIQKKIKEDQERQRKSMRQRGDSEECLIF